MSGSSITPSLSELVAELRAATWWADSPSCSSRLSHLLINAANELERLSRLMAHGGGEPLQPSASLEELNKILSARSPFHWQSPENIDAHPMRYHPVAQAVEGIISTRWHQEKIFGHTLAMSLQIAEVFAIGLLQRSAATGSSNPIPPLDDGAVTLPPFDSLPKDTRWKIGFAVKEHVESWRCRSDLDYGRDNYEAVRAALQAALEPQT